MIRHSIRAMLALMPMLLAAACIVTLTPIDQSWEPRIVRLVGKD